MKSVETAPHALPPVRTFARSLRKANKGTGKQQRREACNVQDPSHLFLPWGTRYPNNGRPQTALPMKS